MTAILNILLLFILGCCTVEIPRATAATSCATGAAVLVNIHNIEEFVEFEFCCADMKIEKTTEGIVSPKKIDGAQAFTPFSADFSMRYIEKLETRKLIVQQYKDIFQLSDQSVAEASDNGKYISYNDRQNKKRIYVAQLQDRKIILDKILKRNIKDIVWRKNSELFIVLSASARTGLKPREILAAISGHPVPYERFFLEIYTLRGDKIYEINLFEMKYGYGSLVVK